MSVAGLWVVGGAGTGGVNWGSGGGGTALSSSRKVTMSALPQRAALCSAVHPPADRSCSAALQTMLVKLFFCVREDSMVIFNHSSAQTARNFFVALCLVSGTTGFSEMNLSTVSENLAFLIFFCVT